MSESVSNARMQRAVTRRLRACPYPAVKRLICGFDQGRLFLRGQVRTFYEKQMAQESVAGLEGIERVVNCVEVG